MMDIADIDQEGDKDVIIGANYLQNTMKIQKVDTHQPIPGAEKKPANFIGVPIASLNDFRYGQSCVNAKARILEPIFRACCLISSGSL